ncbi:MAG: MFS transporter [Chthoniobacterales bacterium]
MAAHDSFRPASRWLALAGVCLGVFMYALDASIVNIAVPTLIRELHTTITAVQWVIQAYLGVVVLLLLPLSRAAARLGQKRIFLLGILLFTVGSFLCGTADTIEALIGFRIMQAVGAACIASLMASIVGAVFPPGQLAQALGIVAATATLGTSLGPTIGGFLIDATSWHSIFLVNIPVGVVAFALVTYALPKSSREAGDPGHLMWGDYLTIFKDARLRNGIGGRLACMMANGAFLFLTPLLLENALHYSTSKAGLFLAAAPILVGLTSPLFGSLADRYGRRRFLLAGLLGMILGTLVMHTFSDAMSEGGFLLRVAVWGVGMGMFNAPNAAAVMAAAPKRLADGASALLSMGIILGQFIGVAAGGALFHWFAFGAGTGADADKIIDLDPAALAGAVANTLPVFALPLIVILALSLMTRRKAPASGSLSSGG